MKKDLEMIIFFGALAISYKSLDFFPTFSRSPRTVIAEVTIRYVETWKAL